MRRCTVCQVFGWGRRLVGVWLRDGRSWDVLVCVECEKHLENKIK